MSLVQDKGNVIKDGEFYFTEVQAKAILDMRLAKLTGLEMEKISGELKNLAVEILDYLDILGNRSRLIQVISDELKEVKDQFATPRRSSIEESEFETNIEDLIPKEDMVVVATMNGYIKRVPLSTYKAQKRGGKGRSGISVRDEDVTTDIFVTNTHTPILFFSDQGKVYKMKTYKLPLGTPQAKGRALVNLLPINQDEKISTILALPEDEDSWAELNIVFATSNGTIRRNSMADFANIQSNGKIAMKLKEGNSLIGVNLCEEQEFAMLSTKNGKCIRFPVEALRVFSSRNSEGVKGIRLEKGNKVIAMSVIKDLSVDALVKEQYLKIPSIKRIALKEALLFNKDLEENPPTDLLELAPKKIPNIKGSELDQDKIQELALSEEFILTITENGFGKRSSAYEYRITNRGGLGITNIITSTRNGHVVASFTTDSNDQVMIITNKGTLIRTNVADVRVTGRNTQGVTLIKTKISNEKVVSVARIAKNEDEDIDELENNES